MKSRSQRKNLHYRRRFWVLAGKEREKQIKNCIFLPLLATATTYITLTFFRCISIATLVQNLDKVYFFGIKIKGTQNFCDLLYRSCFEKKREKKISGQENSAKWQL